jgi:DNA mismatch repair protein MutS
VSSPTTPLIDQYRRVKAEHEDAILFFRVGDFYEMFFDDARVAARELEIALTSRGKDGGAPIPLAGVPIASYEDYAARLLKRGYKIAICEQTSDPKESRGLVDRQVVRVLTPGTVTDDHLLEGSGHNYLMGVSRRHVRWALAYLDLSTGSAHLTGTSGERAPERLLEEILRVRPAELVFPAAMAAEPLIARAREALALPEGAASAVGSASLLWDQPLPPALAGGAGAAGSAEPEKEDVLRILVGYVGRTHGPAFAHFSRLDVYSLDQTMAIDPGTVRNLELVESSREKSKRGSLLWVLDRTATSMGGRLLRRWLLYPLLSEAAIAARLDAVEALATRYAAAKDLAASLAGIHDLPRILAKVANATVTPRDLACLGSSLGRIPEVIAQTRALGLAALADRVQSFDELVAHLARALAEPAPTSATEGGIFRAGHDEELDRLRDSDREAKTWLARFEEQERARTGIRSLKVKYNRVLGYFIEVTKANLDAVPTDYRRKQGMAGGERYVTPELSEMEARILGAEERARALEQELFARLRATVETHVGAVKATSEALAELDATAPLALVAAENAYVRPRLVPGAGLTIQGGRHPVVERMLPAGTFVPNDLSLARGSSRIAIITGPNMAGKSTFLRQAALLTIMAQMGSFVPARAMELDLVDKVFTRVGASDDLASGQSTFMVEMKETAYILANATEKSLVVLDEVGRGTSTYDGLSIAWAIIEALHASAPAARAGAIGASPRTLFATHYHELTELANLFPGITNLHTRVLEKGSEVVFLHKVAEGHADKSYGIHVAMLAGLPEPVLMRAREILFDLEQDEERDIQKKRRRLRADKPGRDSEQPLLFEVTVHPVVEELRTVDVNSLTPLEALNLLARLKGLV